MPALVTTGPSILTSSLFAAAFIWLSTAVGRQLLRRFGVAARAARAERFVICAGLGAGALQFVPLALGAAGVLSATNLKLAMAVVALLFAADLLAVARAARRALAERRRLSAWDLAFLAALAPALLVAALLAFAPTTDPDGVAYHLTVPKLWLQSASLRYLPTYPYSNTPMGVEMLFGIAMAFAGDAAAKTIHFAFGVLGALGLYLACKRLKGDFAGKVNAALYLVGPAAVVGLLGCAYLEGLTTFALGAAALAWILWLQERETSCLRAAFALAGIGASFKITAALFPVALGGLTFAVLAEPSHRQGRPLLDVLRPIAGLVPIAVLPVVPWLARSAWVTGNPVFPMFARWIPSRDLSPLLAKQFEDYNRYLLWASRMGASWSIGTRKLILLAVALLALAIFALAFARMRSYMARAVAIVMLATVLVQLAAVGLYVRYWIPTIAVFAIPLLVALPKFRFPSVRTGNALLIGVTGVASLYQLRQELGLVNQDARGLVSTALGIQTQRSYLLGHLPLYPLYERANALPADAKILLSTYCGGFHVDRVTFCAESVQDSLRFTGWEPFLADVRRLGTTHVLAPTNLAEEIAAGRFATRLGVKPGQGSVSEIYRAEQNEFVGRLLHEHGRRLASASDQSLYAIDLDRQR